MKDGAYLAQTHTWHGAAANLVYHKTDECGQGTPRAGLSSRRSKHLPDGQFWQLLFLRKLTRPLACELVHRRKESRINRSAVRPRSRGFAGSRLRKSASQR